ncbi:hypothetical protein, partial [Nitrososphaera sp.]|uniref:hypothetical protein n=1 Tax=Nitrososphaera sp. TaxID=1971748 RepID=UPI002EDB43A8
FSGNVTQSATSSQSSASISPNAYGLLFISFIFGFGWKKSIEVLHNIFGAIFKSHTPSAKSTS